MSLVNTKNLPHLVQKLLTVKGQFVGVLWTRPMKTRKGTVAVVTKTVRTVVSVGIDYDNRGEVIEARANGELPAKNAGLPWGKWIEGLEKYVIEHNGNYYVRMFPVKNADNTPRSCKVVYRIDGVIATKEQVQLLCLASEFSSGEAPKCFTLTATYLQQIKFAGKVSGKLSRLDAKVLAMHATRVAVNVPNEAIAVLV